MNNSIQVGFFLGADAIAAGFTSFEGLEVHLVDELVDRELVREIRLVPEHQEWNPTESGFLQQGMQLLSRRLPEMPARLVPVIEEIWLDQVVGQYNS